MPFPALSDVLLRAQEGASVPLWLVTDGELDGWLASQSPAARRWISTTGFKAERARVLLLPNGEGGVAGAALGLGRLGAMGELSLWHSSGLADKLPALDFHCVNTLPPAAATQLALGFLYGQYRYDRYRRPGTTARSARLHVPAANLAYVERSARALGWARDLVNTPAADLGPAELAAEVRSLATRTGAACEVIEGPELLERKFPMVHAVGRASARAPRLIDMRWGDPAHPRVTLVGKGVCFDSGGLDLKPAQSMLLMKKDMGGAACALALAQMVMEARLPVRLRVLIPAVDNSVAGDAYRPGDVLTSRRGLSVEIGNTDAEGRLVLADALAAADEEEPQLLVDLATLTGAARTALGPELPALYANDATLATAIERNGREQHDPVWPMPLWTSYDEELSSRVADLNNVSGSSYAGSIIAALFLRRFVAERTAWAHIDLFAWNPRERPGRPVGAEAQCVRALYALLAERFPASG